MSRFILILFVSIAFGCSVDPGDTDSDGAGGAGGGGDIPFAEQIADIAVGLASSCAQECAKDLDCDPDNAVAEEDCIADYCVQIEEYAALDADEILLGCAQAEEALFGCKLGLSCDDYIEYYEPEEATDSSPCGPEYIGYTDACGPYLE